MRQGSLYYYFTTKESLAAEVLSIGLQASKSAVTGAVSRLPEHATFRERLSVAVEAHLYRVLSSDAFSRANLRIFYQLPPDAHAEQLAAREDYARWWLDLIEAGVTAGEVRADRDLHLARMMLLGAMNWSLDWFDPQRGEIGQLVQQFVLIFLDGAGTQNETGERSANA